MSWRQLQYTHSKPLPRLGHTSTPIDSDSCFVFGGADTEGVHNDCYIVKRDNIWKLLETKGTPPAPRYEHTCTLFEQNGKKFFVIFGGADQSALFQDIHFFDLETMTWSSPTITGQPPPPRNLHVAAFLASKLQLLIFGGAVTFDTLVDQGEMALFILDLNLMEWRTVKSLGAPKGRHGMSACFASAHSPSLYVFGGMDKTEVYNDLLCLDTDTMNWTKIECKGTLPPPRSGHSCTPLNLNGTRYLAVVGGMSRSENFGTVYTLNLETLEWVEVLLRHDNSADTSSFPPHINHTATNFDNILWISGGVNFQKMFSLQEVFLITL